jgi:DNA replication protein DnaC
VESWGQLCVRRVKFDWAINPSIPKKQVLDLATSRFVREKRDVLWLGPPGVGKSFLVQAIGYQAIKAGHVVLYRSVFDVVRDFLHDEVLSAEERVLSRYLKPDLLIIVCVRPTAACVPRSTSRRVQADE